MTSQTSPSTLQELPEGTVTVLFTDVVGSTELTNRLGDEPARELLGAADDLVREQVERHRGREVKGTGDGLMIAFTSARRAITCAIDIQRAFAEQRRRDASRAIDVRIGLNTGEVVREEEDLFGATVNAAARIAAQGEAGDILISEGAKILLGSATTVELDDRGEVELRGFTEPWRLYAVRWEERGAGAPAESGRTPYVGRTDERAQLRQMLDQAAEGDGGLVMIGGEPGVGKTRISEELLAEAEQRGFFTLVGHCYEMEGAPPYIPFIEAMQGAISRSTQEGLVQTLGEDAPEIAKVMPELRRLIPDIGAPLELPPEQERHYLFNSLRAFTRRASQNQPIAFLLDDLHWADDSTLLLLQHYAQDLASMAVLMIGTYRDVELDVGRPFAKVLEDLIRQRLAHRITLRRLPIDDVSAMLKAASGQEPPRDLVEAVFAETEGNPFFVEEIYQHFREEGKLFDEAGRWRSDLAVSDLDVPEGVRLVIGRRLERVSEETRKALTNAAIIGRVFGFDLLGAVGEEGPDSLLDAIDEAEEAQLIQPIEAAGREARYTFSHELIRHTLMTNLSLPRRQRLHLRIADAIEKTYANSLDERPADLAHHLYQAGAAADVDRTVRALAMAAEKALQSAAFEDTLRLFDDAVCLRPAARDDTQADLLFRRGLAYRSLGRWDEAQEDWEASLSVYEELREGQLAAEVCMQLAGQLIWSADWEGGAAMARRGLANVPDASMGLRGSLLAMNGLVRSLGGEHEGALHEIDEAIEIARELNDNELLGIALGFKVMHLQWRGQSSKVIEIADEAIDLQVAAGNLWNASDTMWATQYAYSHVLRIDESRAMGQRVMETAERIGHQGAMFSARRGLMGADFITNADIDASEAFWKNDLETSLQLESPWISNAYSNLARINFWRGDWDKALDLATKGAELEPAGITAGFDWGMLFIILAYRGQREEALRLLAQKQDTMPSLGRVNVLGRWIALQSVVEGLAILGERERCAALYPLTLDLLKTDLAWSWGFTFSRTTAGIAATEAGELDEAERHFERALALCNDLEFDIGAAEVQDWYGRMLLERRAGGDEAKARDLLTTAIATYTRYAMPKLAELDQALLSQA